MLHLVIISSLKSVLDLGPCLGRLIVHFVTDEWRLGSLELLILGVVCIRTSWILKMLIARSGSVHEFLPFLPILCFRDVGERTQIPPDGWIGDVNGVLVVIQRHQAPGST